MNKTESTSNRGTQQAASRLSYIKAMMAWLGHAEGCGSSTWLGTFGPPPPKMKWECPATDTEIASNLGLVLCPSDASSSEWRQLYHDKEAARRAIHASALQMEVRSGWVVIGQPFEAAEYRILLCWGWPSVSWGWASLRVVGELTVDGWDNIGSAHLEYRDVSTPSWMEYPLTTEDKGALAEYAQRVYDKERKNGNKVSGEDLAN